MDVSREPKVGATADAENTDMAGQKTDTAKRTFDALSKLAESDSEPEMDTQSRPPARTNLVARLKPQLSDNSSDSSEDDEDDGDAYERVKKMLMAGPEEKAPPAKPAQPTRHISASSSEDEEDMPVRRQRVVRKEPSNSLKASSPTMARSRTSSPGLFVTPDASPVKKSTRIFSASDDDEGTTATEGHNQDLEERVRRIRAERLALQKKEQQADLRKEKAARRNAGSDSSDGENGRRLTQSTRPARKAGKKALEEMAREQQRISRNMQLTHQAKTKKKYNTKDLLRRFAPAHADADAEIVQSMPTPEASSIHHSSDAEQRETPPSSPPTQQTDSVEPRKLDKGKERADERPRTPQPMVEAQSTHADTEMVELSDSDDEPQKSRTTSRFPVFDRIPQAQNRQAASYVLLRHLAHLTSPGKSGPKDRKSMNMSELQASLAQKAREQALKERLEKIEDLRRRGIHVETEEEREKHQLEVEDLVAQFEKAREEDRKLAKREREEAKKNGETIDELPSSDESDDDDYVGSGDEGAVEHENAGGSEQEAELELSGSEDEDMGDVDEEDQDEMAAPDSPIDDAADESQDEADQPDHDNDAAASEAEDEAPLPPVRQQTGKRSRHVVLDDEDEDEGETDSKAEKAAAQATQLPSQTQEMDAMAAFGFDNAAGGIGLTQAFASSMATLNSKINQSHALDDEPEQDSMDFFKSLPDTQAGASFTDTADMIVPNSQQAANQQDEAQASLGMSSLMQTIDLEPTQQSEMFEPTQDTGFQLPRSPAGLDQPPSTIDTVMMSVAESPMPKKKGRLQRGRRAVPVLSDIDDDADVSDVEAEQPNGTAVSEDAFAILAKAAKRQKKLAEKFNKKTSWAKEAVQEQAEESEDEYAGLGGASDEDSGEDDEELAEMIDSNDVKVNERELAAFYADKSKKDDEKNINQLYKDIMNGGLRRRRGGDAFDVSDPEDEIEQRRRRKRQEFQQMTRALIADERIGKIAQNPKQSAFFQTLADHMDDPEYDVLNDSAMDVVMEASNSPSEEGKQGETSGEVSIPDSQVETVAAPANPLKRASPDSQEKENRPPAKQRRTVMPDNMFRKPMTLADVQHSVSELLEDPRVMVPDTQFSDSDSELEIEPPTVTVQKQVVDRLSITRTAILSESSTEAHLAFHAPAAGGHQPGFRIPSLVRRATSNLSAVSTSTSGTTTPVEGRGVRRGGTGRSNIHAQAREAERRAALEKVEEKRKETLKRKVGKAQGKRSILRCLDGGFE